MRAVHLRAGATPAFLGLPCKAGSLAPCTSLHQGEAGHPHTPSGLHVQVADPHTGCQLFFWLRSLCSLGKLTESSPWGPSHHGPGLRVPEPAQHPGEALLAGSLPPAGCCQAGLQALESRGTSPCLQDPSRSSAAAAVGLSRTMQDVWRWPATGRSAWERGCPPRGSACAWDRPHRHFTIRPFAALECLEKAAQIFHPLATGMGPSSRAAPSPPNTCVGSGSAPVRGVGSCAWASGCWEGSGIGLGPAGVTVAVGALHRILGGKEGGFGQQSP